MSLTSIIKILLVNEPRSGIKDGRPWSMQDAECVLLTPEGEISQVGVLPLPKNMMGENAPQPGTYVGAFSLMAGMKDRRIGAVITTLTPYPTKGNPVPAAPVRATMDAAAK